MTFFIVLKFSMAGIGEFIVLFCACVKLNMWMVSIPVTLEYARKLSKSATQYARKLSESATQYARNLSKSATQKENQSEDITRGSVHRMSSSLQHEESTRTEQPLDLLEKLRSYLL